MSRVIQNKEAWHKITLRSSSKDAGGGELTLTGTGRAAYLWIGQPAGTVYTFSGPKALRSLAWAILREVKP